MESFTIAYVLAGMHLTEDDIKKSASKIAKNLIWFNENVHDHPERHRKVVDAVIKSLFPDLQYMWMVLMEMLIDKGMELYGE